MLQRALLRAQAQVVVDQAEIDAGAFGHFDSGGWVGHDDGMVSVRRAKMTEASIRHVTQAVWNDFPVQGVGSYAIFCTPVSI